MKMLKRVFAVAGCLVVCLCAYYTFVVLRARHETPDLARKALASERVTVRAADLSAWQRDALLAVEDPAFYRHRGVDLKTPGAGLTTITQSLVKMFYFDRFKPGPAKVKQSLIARFALDPLVSKDDQLTLFINYIYLGNVREKPVRGFAEAAQAYYGKPLDALSGDEYLSLVAMVNAPVNFNVLTRPGANAERTARIRKVVSGEYKPKHLMDMYYGPLDTDTAKGLAPASYFPSLYSQDGKSR